MVGSRNRPSTDPILLAVNACLVRHARAQQSLVVGFSGGLDSAVLLHAASRLARGAKLDLAALHVHHGLSIHADAWAEACARVCQGLSVPLTVRKVRVPEPNGEGMEAAARRVRHQALSDHSADWILLAHHADDQAETVLHNLLRGAGVRGAAAMPEARDRILRPLLGLSRAMLLDYARYHGLTWIDDESNADRRFTRNFLRHEVLPAIESRLPKAGERLALAASRFREASTLLDDLATLDLQGASASFPLPLSLFCGLSDARARNLLRAMLTWHHVQPPDEVRMKEFVRQLQAAARDRHPRIDLARYSLWCDAGRLCFESRD